MFKKVHLILFFVLLPSYYLVGCGKEPSKPEPYFYHGPGYFDEPNGLVKFSLTGHTRIMKEPPVNLQPGQRSQFGAIHFIQETDQAARKTALDQLNGLWVRYSKPHQFLLGGEFFTFSLVKKLAKLSGLFTGGEISFKQVLLSKPLDRKDAYSGFRIVELLADNNEGIAYFAMKMDRPSLDHSYPTLLMTEYKYRRYGQTDPVETLNSVFLATDPDEASVRIWVYPDQR